MLPPDTLFWTPADPRVGRARRGRTVLLVVILVVLLGGGGAALVLLSGSDDPGPVTSGTPSVTPSPSPSSSPTPTPTPTRDPTLRPVVRARFAGIAEGRRLSLQVETLGTDPESGCDSHTFARNQVAFQTNCDDWVGAGFDIYMFHVQVWNDTGRTYLLQRGRFSLVARNGTAIPVRDVRSNAELPDAFFALAERIKPHESIQGWLVFDGGADLIPAELVLRDGDQRLTVAFVGVHRVFD